MSVGSVLNPLFFFLTLVIYLLFFSLSVLLEAYQFYRSFWRTSSLFCWLFYFKFHWLLIFIFSFPLLFRFYYFIFFWFLRWKVRLLIWDFSSFLCIFINFPLIIGLALSHKFWYVVFLFSFSSIYIFSFSLRFLHLLLCHFVVISGFWWEIYPHSNHFSPIKCCFSFDVFKIFFLSLDFRSLIRMHLEVVVSGTILFESCSDSWIPVVLCLADSGNFSTIIFLSTFSVLLYFFFPLWASDDKTTAATTTTKTTSFCYSPKDPWGSVWFVFFPPVCFLSVVYIR